MMRHMAVVDDKQLSDAAIRSFIERFALVLAGAGMQRMAARAFAALLVSEDGGLTAREFAELLQVSPAAVSGSVRYLENARMARRARRPGDARIIGRWVASPGTRLSAPVPTSLTPWPQPSTMAWPRCLRLARLPNAWPRCGTSSRSSARRCRRSSPAGVPLGP